MELTRPEITEDQLPLAPIFNESVYIYINKLRTQLTTIMNNYVDISQGNAILELLESTKTTLQNYNVETRNMILNQLNALEAEIRALMAQLQTDFNTTKINLQQQIDDLVLNLTNLIQKEVKWSLSVNVPGYTTEFRNFFEQNPPPGWVYRGGGTIANCNTAYPALWTALTTTCAWKVTTVANWTSMRNAAPFSGIGGCPYFAISGTTVYLPDTRGMYQEDAGWWAGVGGVHGDYIRDITGSLRAAAAGIQWDNGALYSWRTTTNNEDFYVAGSWDRRVLNGIGFAASRVVPTTSRNIPVAYMTLPCVYIR